MDEEENVETEHYPPENFAMVTAGVYRAAFPKKKNFGFLKKLNLKTVICLVEEDYPEANRCFLEDNQIILRQFGMPGNKEPFVEIPEETIIAALLVILDPSTHPLLIHCNKGKHRTGCLVGVLRKVQHWSHTSICDEYRRFSQPKDRALDQEFIELCDVSEIITTAPLMNSRTE